MFLPFMTKQCISKFLLVERSLTQIASLDNYASKLNVSKLPVKVLSLVSKNNKKHFCFLVELLFSLGENFFLVCQAEHLDFQSLL